MIVNRLNADTGWIVQVNVRIGSWLDWTKNQIETCWVLYCGNSNNNIISTEWNIMFTEFTGQECALTLNIYMSGLWQVCVFFLLRSVCWHKICTSHAAWDQHTPPSIYGMCRWQQYDLFGVIGDIFVNICLR